MQRALAELPDDPRYALARADCLTRWSELGFFTDDGPQMVAHATEALALLDRAPIAARLAQLDARSSLAYGYYLQRQNAKADRAFADLMKELEESGRDRTLAAADVLNNWSLVHFLGDIRKSEALHRRCLELHRAIEGEDAVNPGALHNYGGILFQLARYAEAEPYYLETIRAAHARDDLRVEIDATIGLSILYAQMGRADDASKALARLDPLRGHKFLANPLRRAFLAYAQGHLVLARGDAPEARKRFAESVALYDQVEAKYIHSFSALLGLAEAELATGHAAAAEAAARRAIALAESMIAKDSPSYLIGLSKAALGRIQLSGGQTETARGNLRAALAELERTLGPEHPATSSTRRLVASAGS
jgi:tetratricopeptide (TPR) repeat protein